VPVRSQRENRLTSAGVTEFSEFQNDERIFGLTAQSPDLDRCRRSLLARIRSPIDPSTTRNEPGSFVEGLSDSNHHQFLRCMRHQSASSVHRLMVRVRSF